MLFRGTESFPDRRARQIWQELGASFGSDSNAFTDATDTVYQLNLPHADRAPLDTSLDVLAEMMSRARFDPAAVEAERPVVLAEKGRRPELSAADHRDQPTLFYRGPSLRRPRHDRHRRDAERRHAQTASTPSTAAGTGPSGPPSSWSATPIRR